MKVVLENLIELGYYLTFYFLHILGEIIFYWPQSHNCTTVDELSALTDLSHEGGWNIGKQ